MSNKFNVDGDAVRRLAELLNETGLSEIEYEVENRRIRVARAISAVAHVSTAVPAQHGVTAPEGLRESGVSEQSRATPADLAKHPGAVTSPMVGNVYVAPAPDAPAFVKVGERVTQGQTLLIVEAMKVMNPIRAPRDGVVTQILVGNGEPVEFGSVLMIIEGS